MKRLTPRRQYPMDVHMLGDLSGGLSHPPPAESPGAPPSTSSSRVIRMSCPHCGHPLQAPFSLIGRQGRCALCGRLLVISVDDHHAPR